MEKLLICIDYQNDFVERLGVLTCGPPALAIYHNILNNVRKYLSEEQDVIFTHDSHGRVNWNNHPESKAFPLHCEIGTKGYELYGELADIEKTGRNVRKINKSSYCMAFSDINEIINAGYEEIELCGVTTDICVLQNAVGFYTALVNSGAETVLSLNEGCCASFNTPGHEFSVDYILNTLGFKKRV